MFTVGVIVAVIVLLYLAHVQINEKDKDIK